MHKVVHVIVGAIAGAAMTMVAVTPSLVPFVSRAIASPPSSAEIYRELQLFGRTFDIVRKDYVDRPDDTQLVASAINGMLKGLDPHSSYMDAKSFHEMQIETSGEFAGLGMQATMENGLVTVIASIDGSPAARGGVLAGDIITQIDGEPIKGLSLDRVVAQIRGPVGTKVTLAIERQKTPEPIQITLTREIIKEHSVNYRDEGGDVAYFRITQFNNLASDELKSAITKLSTKIPTDRLKGYILDLRNNPGGLLDQAIAVSNAFMTRGEIASIRSRNPGESERFDAKHGDLTNDKPLIVLINGGSASASEIVAGALQDQRRATVIGTRSFGKGSVQTIIPLGPGNGALRLTTARYFTPSGRSIQAQGITPDIVVPQQVPKDMQSGGTDISEATLRGHLKAQGQEQNGSQAYVPTDPNDDKALQTALALLRGTEVNPAFPPSPTQAAIAKRSTR